jgi:hypothetical protein
MNRVPFILIVVAALIVWRAPPVPIGLRFRLSPSGASASDVQRVTTSFRRGFYSDSNVTSPTEALGVRRTAALPLDSATRARIGTVVVNGTVETAGSRVACSAG